MTMHALPAALSAVRFTRIANAVDALSSAIAGFALLAGARAFTFTALLAFREPVLGGVGLVMLASVGWLRWRCRYDLNDVREMNWNAGRRSIQPASRADKHASTNENDHGDVDAL
jgi:hypothetical protein